MKGISFLVLIIFVSSFFYCSSQISTHKKEIDDGIRRIEHHLVLNISFYADSDSLLNHSYNVLDKIYNSMEKYSEDIFVIAGHTQKTGNEESEMELSLKRAKTVVNYLIKKGVSPERLTAKGYGSKRQIVSHTHKNFSFENDRIEVVPIKSQKKIYNKENCKKVRPKYSNNELKSIISTNGIAFPTASSKLMQTSYSRLDSIFIIIMSYNKKYIFEISIHSENRGDESINCRLSNERANTIRNYLLKKGIKSDQLIAQGYGSLYPIADNGTPEGRAKNRRIEINLLKKRLTNNIE